METLGPKVIGVKRSKSEILSLLEECSKSGDSVKEFVRTKGIHEATYYGWRNKYGSKPVKRKATPGFAAVKILSSPVAQTAALFAEFNGIRIYQPVTAAFLKELMA